MSPNDHAVREAAFRAKKLDDEWTLAFAEGLLYRGLPPPPVTPVPPPPWKTCSAQERRSGGSSWVAARPRKANPPPANGEGSAGVRRTDNRIVTARYRKRRTRR